MADRGLLHPQLVSGHTATAKRMQALGHAHRLALQVCSTLRAGRRRPAGAPEVHVCGGVPRHGNVPGVVAGVPLGQPRACTCTPLVGAAEGAVLLLACHWGSWVHGSAAATEFMPVHTASRRSAADVQRAALQMRFWVPCDHGKHSMAVLPDVRCGCRGRCLGGGIGLALTRRAHPTPVRHPEAMVTCIGPICSLSLSLSSSPGVSGAAADYVQHHLQQPA